MRPTGPGRRSEGPTPFDWCQRTAYADSGRVVEYGDHCARPEAYPFEVTLVER